MVSQPNGIQLARLEACLTPGQLVLYGPPGPPESSGVHFLQNLRLMSTLTEVLTVAEVVLRGAMNRELTNSYGEQWFTRQELFDDRTIGSLAEIWARLTPRGRSRAEPAGITASRLTMEAHLGFWVDLLDSGGHRGRPPTAVKVDYDSTLWRRSLNSAFPLSDGRRRTVHRAASRLRAVRNHVAHHKPLMDGVLLDGEFDADGRHRRIGVEEALASTLELVGYIDHDVRDWLSADTDSAGE